MSSKESTKVLFLEDEGGVNNSASEIVKISSGGLVGSAIKYDGKVGTLLAIVRFFDIKNVKFMSFGVPGLVIDRNTHKLFVGDWVIKLPFNTASVCKSLDFSTNFTIVSEMYSFRRERYEIYVCMDAEVWARSFYSVPEGADSCFTDELLDEISGGGVAGFASPETKEIWIYVPDSHEKSELSSVVAHEMGHVIDGSNSVIPNGLESDVESNEKKANHYQEFFELTNDIVSSIEYYVKSERTSRSVLKS